MNDFQVRRKPKKQSPKWYFSRWAILVLSLVVLSLARGVYNNYDKNRMTGDDLQSIKAEVSSLQDRQSFLSDKLSRLRTGEGLDEEIRKNFPVAKPGERVIMVVDDKAEVTTSVATSSSGFSVKKMLGF